MGNINGTHYGACTSEALKVEPYWPAEKLRICITGAGGLIAFRLAQRLKSEGHYIIACGLKKNEHLVEDVFFDEYHAVDLTVMDDCLKVTRGVDLVFNFATSTGCLGFFREFDPSVTKDNDAIIGNNMAEAARINGVERYFHASIAYILEAVAQLAEHSHPTGFEKSETEVLIERYRKEFGFAGRIGRFHCICGPSGTWEGGRGKARAAIMDSYAEGVLSLMKSDGCEPEYIGSLNMRELVVLGSDDHKKLGCARALKNWLRMPCFWIEERIGKAKVRGTDALTDGSAEVVGTGGPVDCGSLPTVDSEE